MDQINRWLASRYGSRSGGIRTLWHQTRYLTGSYRQYQRIDWRSVERLVFVCKGNICRSAYAEIVARSLGIESISCGIDTRMGFPADGEAIKIAEKKGFDLSRHKTTRIQETAFSKDDVLVAMEPWQGAYIYREFGKSFRCSLLGLWGDPVYPHIQDPYGANSEYFINCFDYIQQSVYEVAGKISKE